MHTTVKKNLGYPAFNASDLENEKEITTFIQEVEATLLPCAHCGRLYPRIRYTYRQDDKYPCLKEPNNTAVVFKELPHELYAECPREHQKPEPVGVGCGCGIRTQEWHAEDDETDFKKALQLIAEAWNRRQK